MKLDNRVIIAALTALTFVCGCSLKNRNSKGKPDAASEALGDSVQADVEESGVMPLNEIAVVLDDPLLDSEKSYEDIERIKGKGLSVKLSPYTETSGDDGLLSDDRRAECGYEYQLLVNGVPFCKSQKIPVQVLRKKDVSQENISQAISAVIKLIENIASMQPDIKVAYHC